MKDQESIECRNRKSRNNEEIKLQKNNKGKDK